LVPLFDIEDPKILANDKHPRIITPLQQGHFKYSPFLHPLSAAHSSVLQPIMDDKNQLEGLWADALELYEDKAGRDISKEPGIREIHTTNDLLQQLELKDANFVTYRKKNGKFWRGLNCCMEPITLLGGLTVSGLSLSPFAPASQVLGAVLFLVKVVV
jgi:hypothetical protein